MQSPHAARTDDPRMAQIREQFAQALIDGAVRAGGCTYSGTGCCFEEMPESPNDWCASCLFAHAADTIREQAEAIQQLRAEREHLSALYEAALKDLSPIRYAGYERVIQTNMPGMQPLFEALAALATPPLPEAPTP